MQLNYVQTIEEEEKKAKQSYLRLQMMYITSYLQAKCSSVIFACDWIVFL